MCVCWGWRGSEWTVSKIKPLRCSSPLVLPAEDTRFQVSQKKKKKGLRQHLLISPHICSEFDRTCEPAHERAVPRKMRFADVRQQSWSHLMDVPNAAEHWRNCAKKNKKSETGGKRGEGKKNPTRGARFPPLRIYSAWGWHHLQSLTDVHSSVSWHTRLPCRRQMIHLNSVKSPLNRTRLHVSIRPLVTCSVVYYICHSQGKDRYQMQVVALHHARQKTENTTNTRCWKWSTSHKFCSNAKQAPLKSQRSSSCNESVAKFLV